MKNIIYPLILSFFFCACSNTDNKQFITEKPKTAEELREELKSREDANSQQYLNGSLNMKTNSKLIAKHWFSADEYAPDGVTISGVIKNTASIARFKDVRLRINWISETESIINSTDFTVYKEIGPSKEIEFSFKTYPPDATRRFSYEILGATPN